MIAGEGFDTLKRESVEEGDKTHKAKTKILL